MAERCGRTRSWILASGEDGTGDRREPRIGLATVRTLTEAGMKVVAAARTTTPELTETGAAVVNADLSTLEGVRGAVSGAEELVGDLDLLVNNVGGAVGDMVGGFEAFDDDRWQEIFDLNFFSAVRAIRCALPGLKRAGGSIVNVSSIGARIPGEGPHPYTTAKAALTALGSALAEQYGPQGVRVNTVSPARPGPRCGSATAKRARAWRRRAASPWTSWSRRSSAGCASPPAARWSRRRWRP